MNQQYPAWRYAPDGTSRLVHSADQDAALGKEWRDKPYRAATVTDEPVAAAKPDPRVDELSKEIERVKAAFDHSWKRLNEEHDELKAKHAQLADTHQTLTDEHQTALATSQQTAEKLTQDNETLRTENEALKAANVPAAGVPAATVPAPAVGTAPDPAADKAKTKK